MEYYFMTNLQNFDLVVKLSKLSRKADTEFGGQWGSHIHGVKAK